MSGFTANRKTATAASRPATAIFGNGTDILTTLGGQVVELTQSRIPDDENHGIYVDCSYGWAFYLGNLKSVLEGGIDLRNKNVDIKNVINS